MYATSDISKKDFVQMSADCGKEATALEKKLDELTRQKQASDEFKKHVDKVRTVLRQSE